MVHFLETPRNPQGFHAVSNNTDSETATANELDALATGTPRTVVGGAGSRRIAIGVGTLAGVLAIASVASLQAGALSEWATNVSRAGTTLDSKMVQPRTGCSNWADLLLDELHGFNDESCAAKCKETKNCYQANIQPGECSHGESKKPGTCYLFASGCEEAKNICWDLVKAPGPPSYKMFKPRTGCKDWEKFLISTFRVNSQGQCASKCAEAESEGCANFNFQPGECQGAEGNGAGACYLFKAGCTTGGQNVTNTCWDMYTHIPSANLKAYTMLSDDVPAGSTSLPVEDTSAFQVGDTVTMIPSGSSMSEDAVVGAVSPAPGGRRLASGTIELEGPPQNIYKKGDMIIKDASLQNNASNASNASGSQIKQSMEMKSKESKDNVEKAAVKAMAADLTKATGKPVKEEDIKATASEKTSRMLQESLSDELATTTIDDRRLATTEEDSPVRVWVIVLIIHIKEPALASAVQKRCGECAANPSILESSINMAFVAIGCPGGLEPGSLVVFMPTVTILKVFLPASLWNPAKIEATVKSAPDVKAVVKSAPDVKIVVKTAPPATTTEAPPQTSTTA